MNSLDISALAERPEIQIAPEYPTRAPMLRISPPKHYTLTSVTLIPKILGFEYGKIMVSNGSVRHPSSSSRVMGVKKMANLCHVVNTS